MATPFQTAYERLNPQQRLAVDTIDGPVMVVAGPGTGKTQILATRIANILTKTDTPPSSILALTFTESGASAMRKRLISLIGQTAYYVHISTFHSFCADVIAQQPEFFPLPEDATTLSEIERFSILSEIIANNDFQALKPLNSPTYYIKAIIKAISDLKREGITPEAFATLLTDEAQVIASGDFKKTERLKREKNLAKQQELQTIYTQYQHALRTIGRFDFDDMIALVAKAFRTEELLLLTYQEKYQYILVDEYQDTNGAQARVMQQLASYWGDQANLFVVGDINQSIYRFQGASAENVLQFLSMFPNAAVIHLEENYRSSQTILDAATAVICNNQVRLDTLTGHTHALHSQKGTGTPLALATPASTQVEPIFIAEQIKMLLQQGVQPEEIAVIYRTNADSVALASALAKWGIPYEIDGGVNVLTTPMIQQLLVLCRAISGMKTGIEDMELFTLLTYDWTGLDQLTILQLTRQAATRRMKLLDLIVEQPTKKATPAPETPLFDAPIEETASATLPLVSPAAIFDITPYLPTSFRYAKEENIHAVQHFVLKLIGLLSAANNHTFVQWFEYMLEHTGFLPHILKSDHLIDDLNRVNTLFAEIRRLGHKDHTLSLDSFLATIETMLSHNLFLAEERQTANTHAVRLTTAHKSKGQEWDHVFITSVVDGKWGNNRSIDLLPLPEGILQSQDTKKKDQNEDERRLFYVALTRARTQLTLCIPKTSVSATGTRDTVPSIFVTELPNDQTITVDLTAFEADQARLLEILIAPQHPVAISDQEEAFLAGLVEKVRLSATSLNTYLDCPYKFKLNTLLKVPRAKSVHQMFGTAVHSALEQFFLQYQQTQVLPSQDFLVSSFTKALEKELMLPDEMRKRLYYGTKVLRLYYDTYASSFTIPLFVEKLFGFGWSRTYLDDIPLTGKLDKIEWLDESEHTVTIVDYKTGNPKSRNEIEGKTGAKNPAYKRQLIFYKLLTQLDTSFTAKAEQFILDFVEPEKQSGVHKKEAFFITQDEVEEMKTLIKTVMREIRALHFPKTTNLSLCSTCEFAKHCWPQGTTQASA